jgi:hypothetical protein
MDEEGSFVRDADLFPQKIPLNFHGCSVKFSVGNYHSVDSFLVYHMFRIFNITEKQVKVVPLSTSWYEKVLTALRDVVFKSDVSFGVIPLLPETVTLADPSLPYYVLKLGWFVPCHKPLSRLQRISHTFSVPVWVTMVIILLLVSAASWWLADKFKDARSFTSWSSSLYNTWAVTVGVPVTGMPRTIVLRLTLICFVWYCFAMRTLFQVFFTSYLVDPGYQKQLTTLEEILESGIEFGYPPDFDKFYVNSSDWRHIELLSKGEKCWPEVTCIDRIRESGNFAGLFETLRVQHRTNYLNDHNFICPLNDEDGFSHVLRFYVQKGSFLLEFLNRLVSISTESGLIVKWIRDGIYVNKDAPDCGKIFGDYFVFTLSHLRIAFYILFVGHGLSVLLFVGEFLFHFGLRRVSF